MPSKHKDHKSKSNIGLIVVIVIVLIVVVIGYLYYTSSSTSTTTPPTNNTVINTVPSNTTTTPNVSTTNTTPVNMTSSTNTTPNNTTASSNTTSSTYVNPIAGNLVKNPIDKCIGIDKSTPCGNLTSDHCTTKIEEDGTLSIYSNGVKIWSTKVTTTDTPVTLIMQDDANLVIYSKNKTPIWSSGTFGRGTPPYHFILQSDCNGVVYDSSNTALWASGTNGK